MFEFLLRPAIAPFVAALAVGLILLVIQLAFGGGDGDVDAGVDLDLDATPGPLELTGFGAVPLGILLPLWAVSFGAMGLVVQLFGGFRLGFALAAPIALGAAWPVVFGAARLLRNTLLKETSEAVGSDSFLGSVATIVLGESRTGVPTQAKLTDRFGATHYVMVEPHLEGETLSHGEEVVLVARRGATFEAVANTMDALERIRAT